MYGAILGDMIGAPYEFDRGDKTKDFPMFGKGSQFTDDSVMTVAVAEALLDVLPDAEDDQVEQCLVKSMQKWGRKYPNAGYGVRFYEWLRKKDPKPYGSYGNGSAMRVSAAGWLYDSLEKTEHMAELTARVSHNHPEGIKGAVVTAGSIFLARNGASKDEIKKYAENKGYDLSRTCDEIRPSYHHVEFCQVTVPEAITAFLEGTDFEDVIRTAVSLGGDCDTLTCIAGSIAEAFYEIPDEMKAECRDRLPKEMLLVLDRFEERKAEAIPQYHDTFLDGNELIDLAIDQFYVESSKENLTAVLDAIRQRMHADGHFIFPVLFDQDNETRFTFRTLRTKEGKLWIAAFTTQAEYQKGAPSQVLSYFIDSAMKNCLETEADGLIINPWGNSFLLAKELIEMIFEADGDVEYTVPDDPITTELLEDGSFLKRAIEICNRNRTELNLIKLARILRDSWVWVPCTAILSDSDYETLETTVKAAQDGEGLDSLMGKTFTNRDEVRLVPDVLQKEDEYFFPVFTSEEEMGEYGEHFSKVPGYFPETIELAKHNEKNISGIVINAYSEPFVIPRELFDVIEGMDSSLDDQPEAPE